MFEIADFGGKAFVSNPKIRLLQAVISKSDTPAICQIKAGWMKNSEPKG